LTEHPRRSTAPSTNYRTAGNSTIIGRSQKTIDRLFMDDSASSTKAHEANITNAGCLHAKRVSSFHEIRNVASSASDAPAFGEFRTMRINGLRGRLSEYGAWHPEAVVRDIQMPRLNDAKTSSQGYVTFRNRSQA
jgi:hypothetical protein